MLVRNVMLSLGNVSSADLGCLWKDLTVPLKRVVLKIPCLPITMRQGGEKRNEVSSDHE